jgi:hypothetical protein
MGLKIFIAGIFLAVAALVGGCSSFKMTNPPRSATEQLLLSSAADRALASVDLSVFLNQKVFLDTAYFESYDSKYAIGEIRDALNRAGALLEPDAKSASIIIEVRSGALSIDSEDTLIGVPNIGVPIPLAGTISIPEVALYKSETQFAFAKIALLAYANQSRAHIFSSGPLDGKSYNKNHKILFIAWISTDLPEKQKKPEKAEKYRSRFPQYDLANRPLPIPATTPRSEKAPAGNTPPTGISTTNLPPAEMNGPTNKAGI